MRRAGAEGWLSHDVRSRGVTAWALSAALLAFYFGLYLSSEVKQLAWSLGLATPVTPVGAVRDLAGDAAMRWRFPGLGVWLVAALTGAVVAGAWSWFAWRDDGRTVRPTLPREAAVLAAKTAALTLATFVLSLGFANHLEVPAVHGRHLLPAPGAAVGPLPWITLAVTAVVTLYGIARRRVVLALTGLYAALTAVLYGTSWLEPSGVVAPGERSVRAFVHALHAGLDSKWGLYGLLYTMAVTAGGVHMLRKHRHDRYQVVRTLVVMVVQVTFGFSVPVLLSVFARPAYYLSYFWPLKIDAFYPDNILRDPVPFVMWSFLGSLLVVPLLGVFFGKRWYCSWVCGCGGLANTAGDPFRHLSQKGESAWRFERVSIYAVLAIAIVTTLLVGLTAFVGDGGHVTGVWWGGHGAVSQYGVDPVHSGAIAQWAGKARYWYGVVITAVLSGAIGVGLYPLGGTRQWCRNFCPMAAFLGLVQKFGRYRIAVKSDMCISCGMCTKVCEMGIDVRAYAQANESFTRASCVGCGMCANACPRGVLRLENRSPTDPQERHASQLVQIRLRR